MVFGVTFSEYGTYLSANTAKFSSDYLAASKFYKSLLRKDPINIDYAIDALIFSVASGQVIEAIEIARHSQSKGLDSPLFGLVLMIDSLKNKRLDEARNLLSKYKNDLPDVAFWIFSGWANSEAKKNQPPLEFSQVGQNAKSIGLDKYNQALYYSSLGDWQKAASFLMDSGYLLANLNRDILLTQADILYLSGQKDSAIALLRKGLGFYSIRQLPILDKIEEYTSSETSLVTQKDYFNFAIAQTLVMLNSGEENSISLGSIFYYQLANHISQSNTFIKMTLVPSLFELGQYSIAREIISSISVDDPTYVEAQILLAEGLDKLGDTKTAIDTLLRIENENKNNYFSHVALGDLYRSQGEYSLALEQYNLALETLGDTRDPSTWVTHFFRGICYQELDSWENARSDYLRALELSPDQPEVLNYLGYSLIERKERLEQALGMIEKAIEKNPQSGYIVDSLAWGLYKLGRYQEALRPMQKAFELLPFDPIINDHFGDILWNNGRKNTAKLFWKRSLSFNPEADEISKIKKKIEYGLD